jgi:hypothetical protein
MKARLNLIRIMIISILLIGGCQTAKKTVNIYGESVDLKLLEGEWKGEYSSEDTGRSGTIEFLLMAEEKKAFGDVLMIPRSAKEPYHPVGYRDKIKLDPNFPEFLTINFVEIEGGKVMGELAPYWDPEMRRRMSTSFEGVLHGDTIEGTFESRIDQSPIYFTGQWKVFRKKKKNSIG